MTTTVTSPPPISWFRNPDLTELTPLTVTPQGRVFGHIAAWNQDHLSFPGQRVKPPRSRSDYRWFHTGTVDVIGDHGETMTISAGKITQGGGHADLGLTAAQTARYYDDSTSIVALICAFDEDPNGIAFSGAILPDVDEMAIRRLKACGGVSGDWRASTPGGGLDLLACLAVPTGGFAIPRTRVASGAPRALVAAGVVAPPAAAFGRQIVEGWSPQDVAPTFDPEKFAAAVAEHLDARRRAGELAAQHATLVADLDEQPAVVAALLADVDDTPERMQALLADLA